MATHNDQISEVTDELKPFKAQLYCSSYQELI